MNHQMQSQRITTAHHGSDTTFFHFVKERSNLISQKLKINIAAYL